METDLQMEALKKYPLSEIFRSNWNDVKLKVITSIKQMKFRKNGRAENPKNQHKEYKSNIWEHADSCDDFVRSKYDH